MFHQVTVKTSGFGGGGCRDHWMTMILASHSNHPEAVQRNRVPAGPYAKVGAPIPGAPTFTRGYQLQPEVLPQPSQT